MTGSRRWSGCEFILLKPSMESGADSLPHRWKEDTNKEMPGALIQEHTARNRENRTSFVTSCDGFLARG